MSRQFHIYDKATGLFTGRSVSTNKAEGAEAFAQANAPEGHAVVEGSFDPLSQRVDPSGTIVDYQPAAPSADHEWDVIAKRWQLNPNAAAALAAHQSALSQLLALEAKQPRMSREFNLGYDGARARLQELDDQIRALREQLQAPTHE